MNASLTQELLLVKQQLAEAQLIQNTSITANKTAEQAQAKLLEQMEKNYAVAQRVQEEKAKRQESDHYIKGLRDQMREATTRALRVASELDREKSKNIDLRNQIARAQKNKMERLDDDTYEDESDQYYDDVEDGEVDDDDDDENDLVEDEGEKENNENRVEYYQGAAAGAAAAAAAAGATSTTTESTKSTTPKQRKLGKRKSRRGKKKRRKKSIPTSNNSNNVTGERIATKMLRRRPSTSASTSASTSSLLQSSRSNSRNEDKLRSAKNHSTDLFHRLADAKRSAKAAKLESAAKSKQLHALSNHLEKMMALLRAEAAAKASAEEALRSTEDELNVVRSEKSALVAQVGALRLSEKDEMSRDHMLSKQLELMDIKYATLMKTNNFNRTKEQRDSKELRKKMHQTTENMHTMLRRCEDSEIAKRNTVHAFSSLVSNISKMDRKSM